MTRRVLGGSAIVVVVLLLGAVAAFLGLGRPALLPEARAALTDSAAAMVDLGDDGRITFVPTTGTPTTGLILYTGGKVPPAAYAPAARTIAEAGFLVALVPAPFDFAIFDVNAAQAVIDAHPGITAWAVGGHSLGGVAAAMFIDGHPGIVDGLVLWASYSSADLDDDDVLVSSSYGSLDAGASTFTDPANVAKLGPVVEFTVIDGGNHEQMGWYTGQPDDPPATIPRAAQQERLVAATAELLRALEEPPLE